MRGSRHVKAQIHRGLSIACVGIIAATVSGCAMFEKEKVVVSVKPVCPVVRPVCIGKDDVLTEKTATQLEANELGRSKLCGKPPKCKA